MRTILKSGPVISLILFLLLSGCSSGGSDNPVSPAGQAEDSSGQDVPDILYAGVGKADVTGPPAMAQFMGMAEPSQKGEGLLSRTYARAFVFRQGDKKMAYVTSDVCMIFQGVKQEVVRSLKDEGWSDDNIMLQGTHTHAAPGGASLSPMYNLGGGGFNKINFDVQVSGIVKAIRLAEASLQPADLRINEDNLFQCGWNRSPRAYINNPLTELKHYGRVSDITSIDNEAGFSNLENLDPEDREHLENGLSTGYVNGVDWNNTNKRMTLLKIGENAMVNWFALHPTSLGTNFRFVSGDSKGYAESLWERRFPYMTGAFAQANCGDVSGNIMYGPPSKTGIYDWQHTKELGKRQFDKALELYLNANGGEHKLSPVIDYRHVFVDMSCVASEDPKNPWQTSKAAMGGPITAGSTEDSGSPAPLFREGITVDDLSPDGIASLTERFFALLAPNLFGLISPGTLGSLTDEYKASQYPKVILLATGFIQVSSKDGDTGKDIKIPFCSNILPVQLFRIGELIICAMPVEVTTMAGRRIENTIKLIFNGDRNGDGWADEEGPVRYVVVAQCTNDYAGYVTTLEEYQKQYYEGASTQFGPNELKAFQQTVAKLALSMKNNSRMDKTGEPVPPFPDKTAMAESSTSTLNWPLFDWQSTQNPFGGIVKGPYFEKEPDGVRYLKLRIWGAFPNRNLMTDGTYMTVRTPANDVYRLAPKDFLYTDDDPETRFQWEKAGFNQSIITLWFDMTDQPETGTYEFTYESEARTILNEVFPIKKKYRFRIEDVGTPDITVKIMDF
ncbi:MAG TPA: neutral/alkaline non-lysosomal ceramidase N-terminal domain-containing protein [Desulfomonilia bacterium]